MNRHAQSHENVHEVDTGPFTISYRVWVNADASQLWELAANPHRHHELDGGETLSDRVTGPHQLSEGDVFNIWMRQYGLPYTLKMRVVTAVEEREIAWQHPGKHIWRWSLAPADTGGTWVTETFDYSQVKPIMIRGFNWLGILHNNARNIQASLEQLKQRFQ